MTDPFNRLYSKIISEMSDAQTANGTNDGGFDFMGYDKYGEENQIQAVRCTPRKAVQAEKAGTVKTLEAKGGVEETPYEAGDWIMTGEHGEQWPIKKDDFPKMYDVKPRDDGMYNPIIKPGSERTFFRTDKKLTITTEYGEYDATPGYYVRVLPNGKCDCPVAAKAMQTGYKFIKELSPDERIEVTDWSNVKE